MKYTIAQLKQAAKELNKELGLMPQINLELETKALEALVLEAIELIDFEEDEFTEATQKLIDIFINGKDAQPDMMQDELTEKMHSEFTISEQTEIKLRCWSALTLIKDIYDADEVLEYAKMYNVSLEDIKANVKEYYDLKKGKKK